MKIKVGQIVYIKQTKNQDENSSMRPFIIIRVANQIIYGVECALIPDREGQSCFRDQTPFAAIAFEDIANISHIRIDGLETFTINDITEVGQLVAKNDFQNSCSYFALRDWNGNGRLSGDELLKLVKHGNESYGEEYGQEHILS